MINFSQMRGFNPVFSKELSANNKWVKKYIELWATGKIDKENGNGSKCYVDSDADLLIHANRYKWYIESGSKWHWPALLNTQGSFFSGEAIFAGQTLDYLWIFKMKKSLRVLLGWYPIQKIIDTQPAQQLKKSENRITSNSERKVTSFLLQRVKQESSNLITLADEETAEMIDAIRKKAHVAFNEFTSKKTSFENTKAILEEALADLLSLKEILHPLQNDIITFNDILGIKPDDSKKKVQDTYRNLIKIIHPDVVPKGTKEVAENITKLINSAYEHIKNNNGRRIQ